VPDNVDKIIVLPNMSHPREAKNTYKLLWVLDIVSDSSRCYVSLLFKNIETNSILIDRIPPELLPCFTVGSCFQGGKALLPKFHGNRLLLSINSTPNNTLVNAKDAFTDHEYDLSLDGLYPSYSIASKAQSCFVYQSPEYKIVIPSFVIAARYYFRSTSLRHAILSRRLGSLFQNYQYDPQSKHAEIYLTHYANHSDAKDIARFKFDEFASTRLNQGMNSIYSQKDAKYKRIKFDFPAQQQIGMDALGHLSTAPDGSKTFIVFQLFSENSKYPFESLDVYYDKFDEPPKTLGGRPVKKGKSSKRMTDKLPADERVKQMLKYSPVTENPNARKIIERKIAIKKPYTGERPSQIVYDGQTTDLSTQPGSMEDSGVSRTSIGEAEEPVKPPKEHFVMSLDEFRSMVELLNNFSYTSKSGEISVQISGFTYSEDYVPMKSVGTKILNLKESYDYTPFNRRRYAYVSFMCNDIYVCLVEIDQENLPGNGTATWVLSSNQDFDESYAEQLVSNFVKNSPLKSMIATLDNQQIKLESKKHPMKCSEEDYNGWIALLIGRILNR